MEFIMRLASLIPLLSSGFGLVLLVLWVISILWTSQDLKERVSTPLTTLISYLFVIFIPIGGVVVYLLLRPTQTHEEKKFADFEKLSMLKEMKQRSKCSSCSSEVQDDFILCPKCFQRLKNICTKCDALLDLAWEVCPFCATRQTARSKSKE
jgi:RNA polymerase subunit RPABC4/transcription elongation factor Spt4